MIKIMDTPEVPIEKFKKLLMDKKNQYGFNYQLTCTIDEFLNYAYEEGDIEGVRGDIVVAQAILETGWFKFGGELTYKDNNFCGLGVTGASGAKESFPTARIGLRAQVQHLKAYSSKDSLKQECVDPRFKYVTRGIAPYLEDLAGKWAVPGYDTKKYKSLSEALNNNDTYGQKIYKLIDEAKKINTSGGNNMKIAINPGHTLVGRGTGAVGYLNEGEETRKIGKRVMELLRAKGHTVIDCTIDKSETDLQDATNKANSNNADFFCSIHLNSGGGHGTETYIRTRGGVAETYAKRINNKIVASCGFRNRGVKIPKETLGHNLHVLEYTSMPAILVEVCFVDSAEDKIKLDRERVAVAIAEGILNQNISGGVTPPSNGGTTTPPSNSAYNATVIDISSYLIVRDNPNGNEIGKLFNGERVQAFEEKDKFRRVIYDANGGKLNKGGWCGTQYIKLDSQSVPTPPSSNNGGAPYRVRKTWADAASQIGAFSVLENAKKCADENPGYSVFDNAGNKVYPSTSNVGSGIYRVRLTWENAASQVGAFSVLENAKKCADENPGYSVFDEAGNKVYSSKSLSRGSRVKIIGTHYATGQVVSDWAKKQIHTIERIEGDRALLLEITSWCYLKDLQLV